MGLRGKKPGPKPACRHCGKPCKSKRNTWCSRACRSMDEKKTEPDEREKDIIALSRSGRWSLRAIAKKHGVTAERIRQLLRRFGYRSGFAFQPRTQKCEICGEWFSLPKNSNRKTCGRKCYSMAQTARLARPDSPSSHYRSTPWLSCDKCGKRFRRSALAQYTHEKIGSIRNYCSRQCKLPSVPLIEAFGEGKTASEWSRDERCRVGLNSIRDRIKKGWTAEDAIATPPKKQINSLST